MAGGKRLFERKPRHTHTYRSLANHNIFLACDNIVSNEVICRVWNGLAYKCAISTYTAINGLNCENIIFSFSVFV